MKSAGDGLIGLGYLVLLGFALVPLNRIGLTRDLVRSFRDLLSGGHHCYAGRAFSSNLKTLATAQADFRANDRDGNGVQDFWHGDIAGLYALEHPEGCPIKLVDISLAAADARPVTDIHLLIQPGPKAGYHFVALRPPDEADWWDPDRFGACSYPADYGASGTYTFIIGEENVVYKKDLGRPGGIDVYPADPKAEGWSKLD